MLRNINEDWEKKKEYLIRSLFQDIPLLSPVQEEEESFSSGRSDRRAKSSPKRRISTPSPLPPLIIEKEPNRHDEPEEYYKRLDKRIQKAYRKLFIEEQSDVYSDDMRSDSETFDVLDVDESIDMVEAVERKSGQMKRKFNQNNSNSTECSEPKKSKGNSPNAAEGSKSKSQSIDDEKSTSTEILPKSTSDETDERGSLTSPIDITVNREDLEKSDVLSLNEMEIADESVTVRSESISDSIRSEISDYRQVTFQAEVHREADGMIAENEVNKVVAEDNGDEGANLEDAAILKSNTDGLQENRQITCLAQTHREANGLIADDDINEVVAEDNGDEEANLENSAILESNIDGLQEYRQVILDTEVHREADGLIAEDKVNDVVAEDNSDKGANLEDTIMELESNRVSENSYLLERSGNESEFDIEVMRRPNVRLSASSLRNHQRDSYFEDIAMEEPPALLEAQTESSESDKADLEYNDLEKNLDLQDVSTPLANKTIEREHSTSSSSDETIYETDASTQTFDVLGMNRRLLNNLFVGVPTVFRLCSCAHHRCDC